MASFPEMDGTRVSGSVQGSEENAGAHVPAELGGDDLTLDSVENSAQNGPSRSATEAESDGVAKEVRRLLRDVLTQLRQDLGPPAHPLPASHHSDDSDVESDTSGETPMIPEVRRVNFEHFKNQFQKNDGRHIIEALVAGSRLPQAVREEDLKRQQPDPKKVSTLRPTVSVSSVTPRDGNIRRVRIRSKSILYYLSRLADTSTQLDDTRTFLYPFVPLLYFQEEMRQLLALLEDKWKPSTRAFGTVDVDAPNPEHVDYLPLGIHKEASEEPTEAESDSPSSGYRSRSTAILDSGFDTPSTLQEFRAYVAFVDQDLSPLADGYSNTSHRSIMFEELWLLFKPGEYIAATTGPKTLLEREQMPNGSSHHTPIGKINPYQGLWRLYGVTLPLMNPYFRDDRQTSQAFEMSEVEFVEEMEDNSCFRLHCYYIDFDGFAWRPVTKTFCIPAFKGTKNIDSLPACPLRYFKNAADIKIDLIARGKKFMKCITDRHLQYTGWSLVHDPGGRHLKEFAAPMMGQEMKHCEPRYIDSPCIIDFEETLNANPDWSPAFRPPDFHTGTWMSLIDDFEILRWSNDSRAELESAEVDIVQSLDGTDMLQRKSTIERDSFLASVKRRRFGENTDKTEPVAPLRDEDLVLLPKRLFAYALRERCLLALEVERMSSIPLQEDVFAQLKIPRTTKDLIRSVVAEHFEKKRLEQGMNRGEAALMTQDSIGGKGKGLTFLLHGVPGVGKTATAEAVALEHRKPLFILTPGDIGTNSWGLAKSLRYYFRLASRWNCILLLDEADTFLSQRSKYDVERNALVSVFLQVLEYYNGILFLTTNRVGQLDEAFQSRIHLTLYYPSLDKTQTEQIFRVNFKKLRDNDATRRKCNGMPALQIDEDKILGFARRPFVNANNESSRTRSFSQWNGRQIRNAFHLASSLAYRAMAEELKGSQEQGETVGELNHTSVILDDKQFQKIADTIQAFEEYFRETRGGLSDADFAFMAGDRADFWHDVATRPPNHAHENTGRYQSPYSPYGPREAQRHAAEFERGLYEPGESSAYGQRASFHHLKPYASGPSGQRDSSSPRQDIPIRERHMGYDDIDDDPRSREQVGFRERAPPASRGLDDSRSDHGYHGRRVEPHGHPSDSRGGPYARGRAERWERDDDNDDEYT